MPVEGLLADARPLRHGEVNGVPWGHVDVAPYCATFPAGCLLCAVWFLTIGNIYMPKMSKMDGNPRNATDQRARLA